MMRPEDGLQQTIVEGLRYALPPGWLVYSIPNGGFRTRAEARVMKATGVYPGMPDIGLLGDMPNWGAAAFFFEVKVGRRTPSDVQKECHRKLRDLGFPVAVVRSWQDVLAACNQWRIPLRLAGYGEQSNVA